ncbi:MAG: hypothetical protein LV473_08210 [Nitrospira sp.]|nr:hypothetical protein [Nitrospira sp.]
MENIDCGTLIVAVLCGIGLIQLIAWIVVMVRHPGLDNLRLDPSEAAHTRSRKGESAATRR